MSSKSPILDVAAVEAGPGPGSNRTFGLFFAGLFALAAAYGLWKGYAWAWLAGALAAALAIAGALAPRVLARANRAWFGLGMLLARIVNPLVIGIMFFLVITPIGLLMRAAGKRPLSLRFDAASPSYWIERKPRGPAPESMRDQF